MSTMPSWEHAIDQMEKTEQVGKQGQVEKAEQAARPKRPEPTKQARKPEPSALPQQAEKPKAPTPHGSHADEAQHHHHTHHRGAVHHHEHHLLQVEGLSIAFERYRSAGLLSSKRETLRVIDGLNVSVHEGEIIAIVGASGSGKTLLADAIMGIYEPNSLVSGTIYFDGERQDAASLARLRGREIAFVPQSVKSLDPLMRVGRQIGGSPKRRRELFDQYRLDPSVERCYPFELSGGMARRVLLCTALASDPKLIVADEPTPGLDLDLAIRAMDDFRAFADRGGGVLLITHDIELALRVVDRVAVFRDGAVVEETGVESFARPERLRSPFARRLWHALPGHDFRDVGEESPVESVVGAKASAPAPLTEGGDAR